MKRAILLILSVVCVGLILDSFGLFSDKTLKTEKSVALEQNIEGTVDNFKSPNIEKTQFSVDNSNKLDESLKKKQEFTTKFPEKYLTKLDFVPQAPFANWDLPYKEACEEASIIMAISYFNGESIDNVDMEGEILDLVDWQNQEFGYYENTTAAEILRMVEEYYLYKAYIIDNPSTRQLKELLEKGNLLVAPLAGRMLGNPYFIAPGPLYHAALIHGYNEDSFILHDPGTRRGENYEYSYDTIMNALHDYNEGNVDEGVARIVVITPEKL